MTYEARCILAYMKAVYNSGKTPTKSDWLELAHAIATGEVMHDGPRMLSQTPMQLSNGRP